MITVFGTIALDTTRTPFRTETKIMGGAATYASLSSSLFTPTSIVGIVGSDFPADYRSILDTRVDTRGIITREDGKTFHYDSSFDYDLYHRTANKTELNVIEGFEPVIPDQYRDSEYVYLANNDPIQNIKILDHFSNPKLIVCDTIEYWILNQKQDIIKMMSKVDGVVINDEEARLLCKTTNLIKCAKMITSWGPSFTIVKKGEHGSLLVSGDIVFPAPAYPMEDIIDPTGAGDSFAGGFMGHIAKKNSVNIHTIKEAVIYGNVMGAFAVEGFGVEKLLRTTEQDVQKRYETYRDIVKF
ncbi:MAG TPA: PfkB family carbohydrate kinase [Nitrososphaeraceae archaeon]|jgi:sugar/nucleoside kinase (ribokinase family)|nr:PfkB family carbohydrate kinase [Nitrososphaeraceae archaeon]